MSTDPTTPGLRATDSDQQGQVVAQAHTPTQESANRLLDELTDAKLAEAVETSRHPGSLAAYIDSLIQQRDRARGIAVSLEQETASYASNLRLIEATIADVNRTVTAGETSWGDLTPAEAYWEGLADALNYARGLT